MLRVIMVAFTFFTYCYALQYKLCTCQNVQSAELCQQSSSCIWQISQCEKKQTYCKQLNLVTCLLAENCYWDQNKCSDFTDCAQLGSNCRRYPRLCYQIGPQCFTRTTCSGYRDSLSCSQRNLKNQLCLWNGTSCEDITSCEQLPFIFVSDTYCRLELPYCTVSDSGIGCKLSDLYCSNNKQAKQCFWDRTMTKKCYWNVAESTCSDYKCEMYQSEERSFCEGLGCNSDGAQCITRKECSSYKNLLSCTVDYNGADCVYLENRCYSKRCEDSPPSMLDCNHCRLFGADCTPKKDGGCKHHMRQCQEFEVIDGCRSEESCVWQEDRCRSRDCTDADSSFDRKLCEVIGCMEKTAGGCQMRPSSCDSFLVAAECSSGALTGSCIWLEGMCQSLDCLSYPYPTYSTLESCQSLTNLCVYQPYLGCTSFECAFLDTQQCRLTEKCVVQARCFMKKPSNAPLYFHTHEQCENWNKKATVRRYGGCIEKSRSCNDYLERQCHSTLQGYGCKWTVDRCLAVECQDLAYTTQVDCEKQKQSRQKCQLNESETACEPYSELCDTVSNNKCTILIPLDSTPERAQPFLHKRVLGGQTEYGYGFWFRISAYFPQILPNGLRTFPYFLARLSSNDGLTNIGTGDRTLANWIYQGSLQFSTYRINPPNNLLYQTIATPTNYEGMWIQIYFSYSGSLGKVKGFAKFGNREHLSVEFINVQHNIVPQLSFILGGNDTNRFPAFNGYFAQITICWGLNSYIENLTDLNSVLQTYLEISASKIESTAYTFFETQTYKPHTDPHISQTIQIDKDYHFPELYSTSGWFKLDEVLISSIQSSLIRLRQTNDFENDLRIGDRTILLFHKVSSNELCFHTYSITGVNLAGDPNYFQCIETDGRVQSWFYAYAGYNRGQSKLNIRVKWTATDSLTEMTYSAINHFQSTLYYLFLGGDGIYSFQGFLAQICFMIGEDFFNRADEGFRFDPDILFESGKPRQDISVTAVLCEQASSSNCMQNYEVCANESCQQNSCESYLIGNDLECSLVLPQSRCRTNGFNCVKRNDCESVLEEPGCTYTQQLQPCIWTVGRCRPKICSSAPKSISDLEGCIQFLPGGDCIPRSAGGCKTRGACNETETEDACTRDDGDNACIWIDGSCQYVQCTSVCGDGILDPELEDCDDGNDFPKDGCYNCRIQCPDGCEACEGLLCSSCSVGEGWQLVENKCQPICGDGIVTGQEMCDDGNFDSHDGCDEKCMRDCHFACLDCWEGVCYGCDKGWYEEQSICNFRCGDGLKTEAELCDDGNSTDYDGCTACQIDEGFACIEGDQLLSICDRQPSQMILLEDVTERNAFQSSMVQITLAEAYQETKAEIFVITFLENLKHAWTLSSSGDSFILDIELSTVPEAYTISVQTKPNILKDMQGRTYRAAQAEIKLRPRRQASQGQVEAIDSFSQYNSGIVIAAIAISTIFALSGSPEVLWSLFNTLQEISYLQYINYRFPDNLASYFKQFEIFQLHSLVSQLGLELDKLVKGLIQLPYFESKGKLREFNTVLMSNVNSILLILVISGLVFALLKSVCSLLEQHLTLEAYIYQCQKRFQLAGPGKAYYRFKRNLRLSIISYPFSGMLQTMITLQYEICFALFLQLVAPSASPILVAVNYAMACFLFIIMSYSAWHLVQRLLQFHSKAKFAEIFSELSDSNPYKRFLLGVEIIKKSLYMMVLIAFQELPLFQSWTISLNFQLCLLWYMLTHPYRSRYHLLKCAYKKSCLIACTMSFPVYAVPQSELDQEFTSWLGWAHMSVLSSVVVFSILSDCRLKWEEAKRRKAATQVGLLSSPLQLPAPQV